MKECKSLATSVDAKSKFSKDMVPVTSEDVNFIANVPYQSTVCSWVNAMIDTRADIAYAVGLAIQYLTNPRPLHWSVVKRIFHYLKGTMNDGLSYSASSNLLVVGHYDAHYARDIDTWRFTTGYTF